MLLSCLAILLGVAVIIFIVFTIGMEERLKSSARTRVSVKICISMSVFSVSQRPSSELRDVDRVSFYVI